MFPPSLLSLWLLPGRLLLLSMASKSLLSLSSLSLVLEN
jgi:hypothetical protein